MKHNRKIIYWATFLFYVALSLTLYINSTFLTSFVGENLVGVIYSLGSFVVLLALLAAPVIFEKSGGYKFALGITLLFAFSLLGLAFSKSAWAAGTFLILSFAFTDVFLFALDEFLKISTGNEHLGRARGTYLTIAHIALIGIQFIFWLGLGLLPFRIIYLFGFAVALGLFLVVKMGLRKIPEPRYAKARHWGFIRKFFHAKTLRRAYIQNLLLQLFYAWMIIYTPIYLSLHVGFSWRQIGLILCIMLLPFVFVPAYLGNYGDKYGERKMLMLGFAIAAVATLILFFVSIKSVIIWALLLFFTRIGASAIEVMSDAYFFKHIKPENEEFVGVYRTAIPVAYIAGPLLASAIVSLAPSLNFLFAVLSIFMLYGVYIASGIRKGDI